MLLLGHIVYGLVGAFLFVYVVWHAWHDIQRMTNRGIRKYLFVTLSGHDQPMLFRRDILAKAEQKLRESHYDQNEHYVAGMLAAEFGLQKADMLIYVAAAKNPMIKMLMPNVK